MPKVNIGGVEIDIITKQEIHQDIIQSVRNNSQHVYAYANIHAINVARQDHEFRAFLNRSATVYCDGEGVRIGARILGTKLPPRIVLTYWIWELCALCEENGLTMFFLGGSQGSLQRAVDHIGTTYPRLRIAGWHHGFFNKSGAESGHVIKMIQKARPNLLFVGFGMPMQEHWIGKNFEHLHANAIFPSGSMIEYAAGEKPLAPLWMANHGMEWLFRLMQEPRRLWRRYLLGNPMFIFRVMLQRVLAGKAG